MTGEMRPDRYDWSRDDLIAEDVMEPSLLYESPFTDVAPQGPEQVFEDAKTNRLFDVLTTALRTTARCRTRSPIWMWAIRSCCRSGPHVIPQTPAAGLQNAAVDPIEERTRPPLPPVGEATVSMTWGGHTQLP